MLLSFARTAVAGLAFLASAALARGGETAVAVAANFTDAAREIAAGFTIKTGHSARLSFGSSGALMAQIQQAAPFEILLSADEERPRKLVDDGVAVAETRFTYAVGKLVLWSRTMTQPLGPDSLRSGRFNKLAIASPAAAPYGAAAIETMKALGLYDAIRPKVVEGASIAQAFQWVDTRNAEIGFVALSQLVGQPEGVRWVVDERLYTPIRQDAVLLRTSVANPAAQAFMAFLKGPEARAVIEKFGYGLDRAQ